MVVVVLFLPVLPDLGGGGPVEHVLVLSDRQLLVHSGGFSHVFKSR